MRILIFRLENEDFILERLRKAFPAVGFRKCSLNENIDDEGRRLVAIETVQSVRSVMLIESMDSGFLKGESSHAISNLRVMKRLGALDSVKVIAVPERMEPERAARSISAVITELAGR